MTSDAPAIFPVGTTVVTFTAKDAAGNAATATTSVTVTAMATPGRMDGDGSIEADGKQHEFEFLVRERATGADRGSLRYEVEGLRGRAPRSEFVSTAITAVVFSDDPAFQPGHRPLPTIDTVEFTGLGKWNGIGGYSFHVRAADAGEPGRSRDTFTLTIVGPGGATVASVSGVLTGGNIQSSRVKR